VVQDEQVNQQKEDGMEEVKNENVDYDSRTTPQPKLFTVNSANKEE